MNHHFSRLRMIAAVALAIISFAAVSVFAQQNPRELFERARMLDESNQNLTEAIKLYTQVINQANDQRALAAKAQLRIGLLYDRLGRKAEAQRAFQAVASQYSDQADIARQARAKITTAAKARTRLAALAGPAQAAAAGATQDLTLTKIYAGRAYAASISPDGKRLALIRPELSSRDIWTRDIATGKEVRLTHLINTSTTAVWSPDSQWIAFSDRGRNVQIVSADGGPLKTLFTADPNSQDAAGIAPTNWTSDSKKVIFRIPTKGLFAVPAAGGASEPILTFENPDEAKRHDGMTLSPDGRWVAYSAMQTGNADIFVVPTTGRGPIRITTNPAADSKPRWSRDGSWLAFTSSGDENPQVWVIKISPKGEPEGLPVQISKDAHVLGGDWTGSASVGFSAAFRTDHIFTVNVNGTGETQLTQFPSFNARPLWSPNGDWIAFRSDYRKPLNTYQLWTMSSAGGAPRLVSDKVVGSFVWSGDGQKLLFETGAGPNRSVIMEVSARGGEPKEIMTIQGDIDGLSRSPDGRSLVFTFMIAPARFATTDEYLKERLSGIGVVAIGGGDPRILIPADKKGIWYSNCALDPEGKRIAYIAFDYAQFEKEGMYSIWTVDVNGGTPRQIINGGEYALGWSPDAKWIVFEKRIKDMEFDLYKVPANGGEPVNMKIKGQRPEFSPDGKKIVFSRTIDFGYEYWLAENVLPRQVGKVK